MLPKKDIEEAILLTQKEPRKLTQPQQELCIRFYKELLGCIPYSIAIKNNTGDTAYLNSGNSNHPIKHKLITCTPYGDTGFTVQTTVELEQEFTNSHSFRTMVKQIAQKKYANQVNRLSDREKEVMGHITLGKTVKEIAQELQLSPHTVDQHSRSIRNKLGLRNNAETAAFAKDAGII